MFTAITTIFSLLTSGAGGGIFGGIFGLFKQSQERKERVEMARVEIERDSMEYANEKAERDHQLIMLEKGASIDLEKTITESETAMEVANQAALSKAQTAEFKLDTSTGMDNYRASVRPTMAYFYLVLFTAMLAWAFYKWSDTITPDMGNQILLGMFSTLTFLVTSIGTFYFVARRNTGPKS